MSTPRISTRPLLGLGLAVAAFGLIASPASAQLIGRRTVIVQSPAYAYPPPATVVTTGAPVGYSPTVYSSGVVPAAYAAPAFGPGVMATSYVSPTVYSPTAFVSGPVATSYATTTYAPTAAVYAAPGPYVVRARYGPRRTVYRYGY